MRFGFAGSCQRKNSFELRVEVPHLALADRQARVRVNLIALHPAEGIRAGVAHQDEAVLARGRAMDQHAQLASSKPSLPSNIAGISPTCTGGWRSGFGSILKMLMARRTPAPLAWPTKKFVAGDAQPAAVARTVEVAAAPGPGRGILLGRHGDHPVQVLEVAEEVKALL